MRPTPPRHLLLLELYTDLSRPITEKETRDKGIEILESWLKQKQNPTELDYMKVWRALFYCTLLLDSEPPFQLIDRIF